MAKKKTTRKVKSAKKSARKAKSAKARSTAGRKRAATKKTSKSKKAVKRVKKATSKSAKTTKTAKKAKKKVVKKAAKAKRPTAKKKTTKKAGSAKSASRKSGSSRPARSTGSARGVAPSPAAPAADNAKKLNARETEVFRQLLLEKRAEIVGDMNTLHSEAMNTSSAAAGDLSSMPIHMADLGTDNFEREFTLGLMEAERSLLREIDDALDRIRKGTYGLCMATGRPIGKARLKAQPWAKYCYEYMLQQEQGRQFRY